MPSSWNDITQNVSVKEYIGWVWYERQAWVPATWTGVNIMLRFESAHYNAIAVSVLNFCCMHTMCHWVCMHLHEQEMPRKARQQQQHNKKAKIHNTTHLKKKSIFKEKLAASGDLCVG